MFKKGNFEKEFQIFSEFFERIFILNFVSWACVFCNFNPIPSWVSFRALIFWRLNPPKSSFFCLSQFVFLNRQVAMTNVRLKIQIINPQVYRCLPAVGTSSIDLLMPTHRRRSQFTKMLYFLRLSFNDIVVNKSLSGKRFHWIERNFSLFICYRVNAQF